MAKKEVEKFLTMRSPVRTLSIKVYDEQLPNGWKTVCKIIRSLDKSKMQVIAICHDRDLVGDDIWEPSTEKPHYHIIVRILNNKTMRVQQILGILGVVYRKGIDDNLWKNHGVETCADFTNMTVYIPHWSEQAERDGKERYELEELVSNLTIDEIREVMKGYVRVGESLGKVTEKELAEYKDVAYDLGVERGDFKEWYKSLPLQVLRSSNMKVYREMYELGLEKSLESDEEIERLCVFIQSPGNMGKTVAACKVLKQLGIKYIKVGGGGTGKFDKLTVNHGGIIIDDDKCPNLLNMSDTKYYDAYKRGAGNPPWVGEYFIVTSNKNFDEWMDDCGIKSESNRTAVKSRFYICRLVKVDGVYMLYNETKATRGLGNELWQKIFAKWKKFRDLYNESLESYQTEVSSKGLDLDNIDANGDLYWERYYRDQEKKERAEEERKRQEEEEAKRKEEEAREQRKAKRDEKKRQEEHEAHMAELKLKCDAAIDNLRKYQEEHKEEVARERRLHDEAIRVWIKRHNYLSIAQPQTQEDLDEVRDIMCELEREVEEDAIAEIFSMWYEGEIPDDIEEQFREECDEISEELDKLMMSMSAS